MVKRGKVLADIFPLLLAYFFFDSVVAAFLGVVDHIKIDAVAFALSLCKNPVFAL